MARVAIVGFETGDLKELGTVGGGVIESTTVNSANGGAYSEKFTTATTAPAASAITGLSSPKHFWFKSYFRVDTVTTPATIVGYGICYVWNGSAICIQLVLQQNVTTGIWNMNVVDNVGASVGAFPTLTINANTWYCFEGEITIDTTSTGSVKYYQDGVLKETLTGKNFGTAGMTEFQWGAGYASEPAGRNYFYDDIEIDDAALCGQTKVIARQFKGGTPTYVDWTKNGGTNIEDVWNATPFATGANASSATALQAQTALTASFAKMQTGHGTGVIGPSDTLLGLKAALMAKCAATSSGITQIGTNQATSSLNGVDITLTFSTAPLQGDVVYVWGGHFKRASTNIGPSTAGYTQLFLDTSTNNQSFGVWRKVMGATPDTTVVCQGTGNSADSTAYASMVLRGVDNVTPEDATTTTASGSSTNPNAPSITTVTDNAWVLALAASQVSDGSPGTVSGYSNQATANSADTNPCTVAGSNKLVASHGAEDPAAWSAWSTGQWFAASVAVRPAVDALSAAKLRRRMGGTDTDTALTLTTSDALYSVVFSDSWNNMQAAEVGVVHGDHYSVQTVEDAWLMASYIANTHKAYPPFDNHPKRFMPRRLQ